MEPSPPEANEFDLAALPWALWSGDLVGPDLDLGFALALLLVDRQRWAHRIVESVRFEAEANVKRRVSLDFSLPTAEPEPSKSWTRHLVPVAFLSKRPLIAFDMRDEGGNALPVLTRQQNETVAWSVMIALALLSLSEADELPDGIVTDLWFMVAAAPDAARQARSRLRDPRHPSQAIASKLWADPLFSKFADDFTENFLLLVPIAVEPGRRRILKYGFETTLPGERFRLHALNRAGWDPTDFRFLVPNVGQAESYHFETEAPPGLEVADAHLLTWDGRAAPLRVDHGETTRSWAHLYTSDRQLVTRGVASVRLGASRRGLLRAGAGLAFVTVALLSLGAIFAEALYRVDANGSVDAAAAVLVALPGILSALLVRPGEHVIVSDLLLYLRMGILATGLAAYVAAISLVLELDKQELGKTWDWLAGIAVVMALVPVIGYLLAVVRAARTRA